MDMDTSCNVELKPAIDIQQCVCKYCFKPEIKQDKPGLTCETCKSFVHLNCLKRLGTPGDFACDVFFEFICAECSNDMEEVFIRRRFPWVNVLLLTLHHLSVQSYGISNNGFFHYKTHICSFIDRNWVLLFGTQFKQKKNWVGTIAGALSVYNNTFFMSGSGALGETGWWRLLHSFSPAVAAHINLELSKDKIKGRPRGHQNVDKTQFICKVTELGYKHLVNDIIENQPTTSEAVPFKKRRFDIEQGEPSCSNLDQGLEIKQEHTDEITIEEHDLCPEFRDSFSDVDGLFPGFQYSSTALLPNLNHEDKSKWTSDSSSVQSLQQTACYDSDSGSPRRISIDHFDHFDHDPPLTTDKKPTETKPKREEKEKQTVVAPRRDSLFSSQPNSVDLPWLSGDSPKPCEDLVPLSEYEEVQLLKKVEGALSRALRPSGSAHLQRFRAKLALRRLKRHKHLPIFDLDKAVKLLNGYATEDPKVVLNAERILDRFQRSYLLDNLSGTVSVALGGATLVSRGDSASFRSPYSGATLKPYVRRDSCSVPLWLKLTDELLTRTHRHVSGYRPPRHSTLDYSYVRPQHVAPVNALLAQFFWPGIDITEALQHPEFSCVVTYKKLVVACAFLVPDVGHNEAYISFILTRPEWRNAKIATFMLYHLLQTCTGKDVTLHVSPTNPAIFLYQKFGFKVEELIQDFYEKYYDIEYKGCRHALFLRLSR